MRADWHACQTPESTSFKRALYLLFLHSQRLAGSVWDASSDNYKFIDPAHLPVRSPPPAQS
eukprot:1142659-Pleurochrysis_carterae.AAC.1